MKAIPIAYATALLELAYEQETEDILYDTTVSLQKALEENPGVMKLLASPILPMEEAHKIISMWLLNCELLENTIYLMCQKHHGKYLMACLYYFIKEYRHQKNILFAQVISAMPLKSQDQQMLKKTLETITKQNVTLEYIIDKQCIGGLKIVMENRVFDGSLQRQFDQLRSTLTKSTLDYYD